MARILQYNPDEVQRYLVFLKGKKERLDDIITKLDNSLNEIGGSADMSNNAIWAGDPANKFKNNMIDQLTDAKITSKELGDTINLITKKLQRYNGAFTQYYNNKKMRPEVK